MLMVANTLPEIKIAVGTLLVVLFVDSFMNSIYINNITNNIKTQVINSSFNACYYSVYVYSLCRIKFNKYIGVYYTKLSNKLRSITTQKQYNTLESYSNSFKEIQTNIIVIDNEEFYYMNSMLELDNYSTFVFTDKTNNGEPDSEDKCFNKVVFDEYPTSFNYTPSNITFISLELHYDNNTYPIFLKTARYNYYIVNNKLNANFFKYYLITNHSDMFSDGFKENEAFEYTLTLIDHNVNVIELTNKQYIVFLENDYALCICDKVIYDTDVEDNRNGKDPVCVELDDFINVEISENDTFNNYYTQVE